MLKPAPGWIPSSESANTTLLLGVRRPAEVFLGFCCYQVVKMTWLWWKNL